MAQASFEPGTSRFRVLRSTGAPHWLGDCAKVSKNCVSRTVETTSIQCSKKVGAEKTDNAIKSWPMNIVRPSSCQRFADLRERKYRTRTGIGWENFLPGLAWSCNWYIWQSCQIFPATAPPSHPPASCPHIWNRTDLGVSTVMEGTKAWPQHSHWIQTQIMLRPLLITVTLKALLLCLDSLTVSWDWTYNNNNNNNNIVLSRSLTLSLYTMDKDKSR